MSITITASAQPAAPIAVLDYASAAVMPRVTVIGWLVQLGDIPTARDMFTELWRGADGTALHFLCWALATLERRPHKIATARIRAATKTAPTPDLRELAGYIADNCDPTLYRPQRAVQHSDPDADASWETSRDETRALLAIFGHQFPRPARERAELDAYLNDPGPRNARTAAHDIARYTDPSRRIPRTQQRRTKPEPRVVTDYVKTRLHVDDDAQPEPPSDGYALDFDRASLPPSHGDKCVSCWIERARADASTHARRSDDGLCADCRDAAHRNPAATQGLPELPEGYSRADYIGARAEFITAAYPAAALTLLRAWWCGSGGLDRGLIAKWVERHQSSVVRPDSLPSAA